MEKRTDPTTVQHVIRARFEKAMKIASVLHAAAIEKKTKKSVAESCRLVLIQDPFWKAAAELAGVLPKDGKLPSMDTRLVVVFILEQLEKEKAK